MRDPRRLTTDPSRVSPLRAIVCDVDGTLTDGTILLGPTGDELKAYDVRDGLGITMALRAGLEVYLMTGRPSASAHTRGRELGVTETVVASETKSAAFQELLARRSLTDREVCYIGDDLTDLVPVRRAQLGVAVADAHEELREVADLVCTRPGGRGAVREVIELILQVRGDWERLVRKMDPDYRYRL